MNFYNQYKDLFQIGSIPTFPRQRLRLDDELFIDRPYVPAYRQQHNLSSKLRQLNKDYHQFESQVKLIQQLSQIPKRSQSRRKQTLTQNNTSQMLHHHARKTHNLPLNNEPNIFINDGSLASPKSRNFYSKRKQQSTIFDHYKDNQLPSIKNNNRKQQPIKQHKNQQHQQHYNQKHQDYQLETSYQIESSSHRQQYQMLKKQNDLNTQRMIASQNMLANKIYQQQNNNILKQSQINHVFNWKLQQPQPQIVKQTTIPKYKISNPLVEMPQNYPSPNYKNTFNERSSVINNRNSRVKEQRQVIGMSNNNNNDSNNMTALERRRIAKQKIDERREKLRAIIKKTSSY